MNIAMPRTRTLDRLPVARVRPARTTSQETIQIPRATMRDLVDSGRTTAEIPRELLDSLLAPRTIDRAELERRVRERLIQNGAAPEIVELVLKPGFFVCPDGLENLARALGVLDDDETVA
jgi:hypothetical protein